MAENPSPDRYKPFAPFKKWERLRLGDAWAEFLSNLEGVRQSAKSEDLDRAMDIALRSAALESGAIEGLYATTRGITRTVAVQGAMWEAELDKLGPDVRGHFEAQLAAFDLVLDAATKNTPISEAWLRQLHARVSESQRTYRVLTDVGWQEHELTHGAYKSEPNSVTLANGTIHWYAPVTDTPAEMHRLVQELRSPSFSGAHPVLQAAFAHHALTAIHPFADGNGRVARALASVFLYRDRKVGLPLVIFSDQQERYWDALAAADAGNPQAFVGFMEDRTLDTMALVTSRLREAGGSLEEQATRIRGLFIGHGGLTHGETQALGQRLIEYVQRTLTEASPNMTLAPDISASVAAKTGPLRSSFWDLPYRTLKTGGMFTFALRCRSPEVTVETNPIVGVATDTANPFAFVVVDSSRELPPLKLRVTDIHPAMTTVAETLIEGWTNTVLKRLLDDLHDGIANAE